MTFIKFFFQKCFRINKNSVSVSGDELSQSHYFTCVPSFLFSSRFSTLQSSTNQLRSTLVEGVTSELRHSLV